MTKQQKQFITDIYKLCKQYGRAYDNICPIAVTAQAVNESRWGQSLLARDYHNYFGLKASSTWQGKTAKLKTKEEYKKGHLVTVYATFRAFDDMPQGVEGYYKFINTKRYANLKNLSDPLQYLTNIRQDGYATSYTYVQNVYQTVVSIKNYLTALDVIDGEWGNGEERKLRLTMKGYDYRTVQNIVNEIVRESNVLDV